MKTNKNLKPKHGIGNPKEIADHEEQILSTYVMQKDDASWIRIKVPVSWLLKWDLIGETGVLRVFDENANQKASFIHVVSFHETSIRIEAEHARVHEWSKISI